LAEMHRAKTDTLERIAAWMRVQSEPEQDRETRV